MAVSRETTLVVAATVMDARQITDRMGGDCLPMSPRSIRAGAGRGLNRVVAILVAETVWPLPDDVAAQLSAYNAPIIRMGS